MIPQQKITIGRHTPSNPDQKINIIGRILEGGMEVYRLTKTPAGGDAIGEQIRKLEDLAPGMEIVTHTLFGPTVATVDKVNEKNAEAVSGKSVCWLSFAKDERQVWTCWGMGSIAALAKIDF